MTPDPSIPSPTPGAAGEPAHFDVRDQVIVVTGGLGRLGGEYSRYLARCGAFVATFDLPEAADAAGSRVPDGLEDRIMFFPVDVTRREAVAEGLAAVEDSWEAPHGLVNNAGVDAPPGVDRGENGPFESYGEDAWNRVMTVNATGTMLCCQVIGGRMAELGRGSVINIGSIYGVLSPRHDVYEYGHEPRFFKPVAYGASKAAALNLTRYLATYWASAGVRVNALTLAGVFDGQDERFLERYCRHVPLGRMARRDEFNAAVRFLLSDASSYMTGSELVLDGGWTAW